ncbi:hypothetical protein ATANTOWER_030413 [Ataeniobius toweri]|uniref:Uncharacterized protein n=1 Tax=Ataeniobius toweri TaxID=208326 RepID=A0ABU7BCZ2_9TELE|nr:hypothetical protein [Ataeniobius toweri]
MHRITGKGGGDSLIEMSPTESFSDDVNGYHHHASSSTGSLQQGQSESPLTPDVRVESCESLNNSLASLAPSDCSDGPLARSQTLEQINALTGLWRKRALFLKYRSRVWHGKTGL